MTHLISFYLGGLVFMLLGLIASRKEIDPAHIVVAVLWPVAGLVNALRGGK